MSLSWNSDAVEQSLRRRLDERLGDLRRNRVALTISLYHAVLDDVFHMTTDLRCKPQLLLFNKMFELPVMSS